MHQYIKLNVNAINEEVFKKIYAVKLSSNYNSYG